MTTTVVTSRRLYDHLKNVTRFHDGYMFKYLCTCICTAYIYMYLLMQLMQFLLFRIGLYKVFLVSLKEYSFVGSTVFNPAH